MSAQNVGLKRQDLPPGLWVVATPIGHVADLSPRARLALEQATVILCEDTRRTSRLLGELGVDAGQRLKRFDANVEKSARDSTRQSIDEWIDQLRDGHSVALVSDAGTPLVNDPGATLVRAAHAHGVSVVPIPGPCSVVAFLSGCGLSESQFSFHGYFPRESTARTELLQSLAPGAHVFFESPERIESALLVLSQAWTSKDSESIVFGIGKELTKRFEWLWSGRLSDAPGIIQQQLARDAEFFSGEWLFGLRLAPELSQFAASSADSEVWGKALRILLDVGVPTSDAAKRVSQAYGVSRHEVYAAAVAQKNSQKV